jgi:small-conductance mechanosensitive channel
MIRRHLLHALLLVAAFSIGLSGSARSTAASTRATPTPEHPPTTTRPGAAATAAAAPTAATAATAAQPNGGLAIVSAKQVTNALYDTVNWYRALGAQQIDAQAGDALIVYGNRQLATQVVRLALNMARADAELLSSAASQAAGTTGASTTADKLRQLQAQLDQQAQQIRGELQSTRKSAAVTAAQRRYAAAKAAELEGELAVVNARINLVNTMAQFLSNSDAKSAGANALKQNIAAIEASLPSVNPNAASIISTPTSGSNNGSGPRLGLWNLAASAFGLAGKIGMIDGLDRSTAALEAMFDRLRSEPLDAIKSLTARTDQLAAQADQASSATMAQVRAQLDTVAWQYKQTAGILLPLSQEHILLEQYRHNLRSWRELVQRQERASLEQLGVQLGVLALVLSALFVGAEVWRRAVLRYEHEPRRRHQWLLVRRLTLWTLVLLVIGFTFVTQISSVATFAGLITAGLAVAMQSVIVSVVGYLFLIGKYGVRVGDRVQIGEVTGEVVDLGLVRMHLMELSAKSNYAPTGRIVAFANSVVFQASGGLFRQIPGVNFTWHDTTLNLPAGIDYGAVKERLLAAVREVVQQYQDNMIRQTSQLQETLASRGSGQATPRVQLHFSGTEVQAHVWYPVYLPRAAEIDERVSQQLWRAIAEVAARHADPHPVLREERPGRSN